MLTANDSLHIQPELRTLTAETDFVWSRIQANLAAAVDDTTFRIWLEPLRAVGLTEDTITITAPPQTCGWVRERFGRLLQTAAAAIVGPQVTVDLQSAGAPSRPAPRAMAPEPAGQPHHAADLLPNPKLSFEQFVIGDSNRLAHAAALTVAEMPSQAYNPLFLCGPPGVGKTHLLHAIAALIAAHNPGLVVRLLTGEQFATEFLSALACRETEGFKARFRRVDVLLIDDVQFLERKARTEEEFFHTFNSLHEAGSQIVLTSDRPPRSLQDLEDRLRERFASGLVADVQPPDHATRMAILRKRAAHDGIQLTDPGVLHTIADRITLNVRSLEGALIRVVAFSSLTGRPTTAELAAEVLDGLYPDTMHTGARPSIAAIQSVACEHFGVSSEELLSASRSQRVAWPRQIAMYLARELTKESLPSIGRHFGGRDHTTVLHAWRRTRNRLTDDEGARLAVETMQDLLRQPHRSRP